MTPNPLVSIVIPVYNQEKYLDAAYSCLKAQSYTHLEFVFVNDGSTDKSAEMLHSYSNQDERVKIIEKPNGGLVDATLTGIAAATGEYLCFLDPDDRYGPDHITFFLNLMTDDCDYVAAGIHTENNGVFSQIPLREDRVYTAQELRQLSNVFFYDPESPDAPSRFYNSRWNKFYRTELVREIATEFSAFKHITLGEDTVFTYLLLQKSRGGRTVKDCNSYYYNIGNMSSMTKRESIDRHFEKAKDAFDALKLLTERYGTDVSQAYALYENQINFLFARLPKGTDGQFDAVHLRAERDPLYRKALSLRGENLFKLTVKSMLRRIKPLTACVRKLKQLLKPSSVPSSPSVETDTNCTEANSCKGDSHE